MTNTNEFNDLFAELVATRNAYEHLRTSNGSLAERASALNRLHGLRSALAELRNAH